LTDLAYGVTACRWDSVILLDKLWHEYWRIAKDTAAFVFTATQPFTTQLISSCKEWFRYELIWEKPQGTNPLNAMKMPLKSHENIVVFYKRKPIYNPQMEKGIPYSRFVTKSGATIGEVYGNSKSIHAANLGTRYPKSVLRFKQDRSGLHPTQKPVPLMEYLIRTFSNEGDVVLDSCMGSGTTGVAAMNTKRKFIGIELDPEYFARAEKRLRGVRERGIDFGALGHFSSGSNIPEVSD
jgi:site-specific DNA-methyltransferase (adenine-specific)